MLLENVLELGVVYVLSTGPCFTYIIVKTIVLLK